MSTSTQPVTAEELLLMPDDGFRYELVRGILRKMVPAGHLQGRITMNFSTGWRSGTRLDDTRPRFLPLALN